LPGPSAGCLARRHRSTALGGRRAGRDRPGAWGRHPDHRSVRAGGAGVGPAPGPLREVTSDRAARGRRGLGHPNRCPPSPELWAPVSKPAAGAGSGVCPSGPTPRPAVAVAPPAPPRRGPPAPEGRARIWVDAERIDARGGRPRPRPLASPRSRQCRGRTSETVDVHPAHQMIQARPPDESAPHDPTAALVGPTPGAGTLPPVPGAPRQRPRGTAVRGVRGPRPGKAGPAPGRGTRRA
jgi:hypothetical protein